MKKRIMYSMVALVLVLVAALPMATPVMAQSDPPDATTASVGMSLSIRDLDDNPVFQAVVGQELRFRIMLSIGSVPEDEVAVNYEGGTLALKISGGPYLPVAGYGGTTPDEPVIPKVSLGNPFIVMAPFTYTVHADDIDEDGLIKFAADYGQTGTNPDGVYGTFLFDPVMNTASATTSMQILGLEEQLTVTKTIESSYTRTHDWEIEKRVETENEETVNGTPKIWLVPNGAGDETATWTVCVTYLGFEDSDHNVSGTITIENTGTADAVITGVVDELCGEEADVDFPVTFPYTLPVGQTLAGTYSADTDCNGLNVVTVTTARNEYTGQPVDVEWNDPDEEIHAAVEVTDTNDGFANKYGDVFLSANDYQAGDDECYFYSESFAWADYDDPDTTSWDIDNTAQVIGDGDELLDEDDAQLKINWLDEELTLTKTVETSFERTHEWEIEKWVETENEETVNGTPKIWLTPDGSGDETATWNVCVTYIGYSDHDHNVSGNITIENTGTADAVITGVVDELCGEEIDIVWVDEGGEPLEPQPAFPYLLEPGETLEGTYSEDTDCEQFNVVTVTTERDEYASEEVAVVWGEPDEEIHAAVEVTDTNDGFANKYGDVFLSANDYQAGDDECYFYSESFAWADYDDPDTTSWDIDNTAQVIGDGDELLDEDDAKLKINTKPAKISLEKNVWDGTTWHDADAPSGPHLPATMDPVIFRFLITNTGTLTLNVTLTDTHMTEFYTDQGLSTPAVFPIPGMAPAASVTVYGSLPWEEGQHSNNATATGVPEVGDPVFDSDPCHYFGISITVGWETHPVNKAAVLAPWIALLATFTAGATLLLARRRRALM